MRKGAAVAVLLLLALGAVAAEKSKYNPKKPYVLDCDDDTADCDAENPKHHKKEVEEIEVDVPEGWSPEHRGDIVKVKTPKFNPVPKEEPKDKKEKKEKMEEDPLKDTTEKRSARFRKIKLPVFEAKPVEVPKDKPEKKEKMHEDPLKDTSEKREEDFAKIKLPKFDPKPKPEEKEPKKKTKWIEDPVEDVTEPTKHMYEEDKWEHSDNADGMKQYHNQAKKEAQEIQKEHKHNKDYGYDSDKDEYSGDEKDDKY